MIIRKSNRMLRKEYVGNEWDVVEIYISAHNMYDHNMR